MIVEAGELRGYLDSPLCNMEVANGKRNNDPNVETHRFSIGHSHHWLRCGCREPIPLAVGAGEEMQTRAVDQYLKDTSISAKRGTIYDCNMKVLAKSAGVWKVVLEPNYITDDNRGLICNGLSQILGLDKADLIERSKKKTYYDVVQNKVETDVKDQIVAFKEENEITNGIRLIPDYKRYYPYGKFASSVLGFTGSDNQGLAGIERSMIQVNGRPWAPCYGEKRRWNRYAI